MAPLKQLGDLARGLHPFGGMDGMDDKERQAAFLTALTTEHFVLQTAAGATVSEAAARASLYMLSLSSSLVAMGFASRSQEVFMALAGAVLPALFVLGLFTVYRLIDTGIENQQYLTGIARIRGYYRTLTPEAAVYFSAASGRWPESPAPSGRFGPLVAFLSTAATMISFINSMVAGAGVALLASHLLGPDRTAPAVWLGVATTLVLMAAFQLFQRWRYSLSAGTLTALQKLETPKPEGPPRAGDGSPSGG
ncbi:MAG TPA: hypothetical protein VGG20_17070 [Thermoanaerobaculia bacterium]|jgi:hypothetical protein